MKTVELSQEMIFKVCCVALSDIRALESKLDIYKQANPKSEAEKRRINMTISDIEKSIESATEVHNYFTELLED